MIPRMRFLTKLMIFLSFIMAVGTAWGSPLFPFIPMIKAFFTTWGLYFGYMLFWRIALSILFRAFNIKRFHGFVNRIDAQVGDYFSIENMMKRRRLEKQREEAAAREYIENQNKANWHDHQAKKYAGTAAGEKHKKQANYYRHKK